jgi:hypothetical protein
MWLLSAVWAGDSLAWNCEKMQFSHFLMDRAKLVAG